ncbi:carbohydrate kinase [Tumebacillus sp. ITR2]|uniref:Carbohydrate kinase n=1 Tax=Tumebacillus amylolyticus TaxID=2801339 RepID=A0ABS1JGC0_9BACL|nr:PfkB family carbohydrate kinase [Tumebacillus amylolyticus]MBL0389342.1 carbohydrate kinase [Tumebacillus amylolyticus]
MFDVLAIGEMLIDFTPSARGVGLAEVPAFEKKPGGAPANVAVGVAKLGGHAAFLGKFGQDPFGDFLIGTLEQYGVDTVGCVRTTEAKTGLAFIAVADNGEHEFHFYRDPSADMLLSEDDIREEWIQNSRIVHVGSVTQVLPEATRATRKALELARKHGVITSFDVNFRLGIWRGREEEGKRKIFDTIALTDVLKVSESEMTFLTGTEDVEQGAQMLLDLGPKIVFVTLGERGVYYITPKHRRRVPTFRVTPVDVTGAGDGFVAGFLRQLADRIQGRGIDYSLAMHEEIEEMTRYGAAVGALTVSQMGAIPALPTKEEVFQFMYKGAKRNPLRIPTHGE